MRKRVLRAIWFITICVVLVIVWPEFTYNIHVDNLGENGVVITKVSYKERYVRHFGDQTLQVVHLEYPELPDIDDPSSGLGRFDQYGFLGLPDKVEVEWQLAELTDCEMVYTSLSYPGHVRKSGCQWSPLPSKVYRKVFDMDEIRDTPEYRRTGNFYEGIACSRHVLDLHFVFREGDLQVKAYNSVTNPWK